MKLFSPKFFFFLLFGLIFCLLTNHYMVHVTDDGFIFFRYVDHLVQNHALIWNKDEAPIEGFSSPLWIFLLSFGKMLGVLAPSFSIFLGSCSIIGTAIIMKKTLPGVSQWSVIPIGLFLILGAVYYWSLSGMETGVFMFCFLASFASIEFTSLRYWVLLLGITRPEGFLLMLPWSVLWFKAHPQKSNFLVLAWIPTILYFLFRILYFDSWLPNTYYAKVGAPIVDRLRDGITYTFPVLVSLIAILCTLRSKALQSALFVGCSAQACIVIVGGGDWMTWGRMLVPMLPFIIIMVSVQISKGYWPLFGLIYLLFPYFVPPKAWPSIIQGKELPLAAFQEGGLYRASQDIAQDIRKNVPKGATIAINHAGFLPYLLPEYSFIDMTGLNDKYIAHRTQGGLHQKYDAVYILRREPELIILNSLSKPTRKRFSLNYWVGETALYEHPEFLKNYQMLPLYYERSRFGGGKAYITLFSRYKSTD